MKAYIRIQSFMRQKLACNVLQRKIRDKEDLRRYIIVQSVWRRQLVKRGREKKTKMATRLQQYFKARKGKLALYRSLHFIRNQKKVMLVQSTFRDYVNRKEIAKESWINYGAVIICNDLFNSMDIVNKIAPEHLEIAVDKPKRFLKKIKNAGAIFLGRFTPEAIGDYVAGPNHVLPTDRTARFSSGLNLLDYFKRSSVVECNETNLKKIGQDAINLAYEEGLQAHALSIECRLNK